MPENKHVLAKDVRRRERKKNDARRVRRKNARPSLSEAESLVSYFGYFLNREYPYRARVEKLYYFPEKWAQFCDVLQEVPRKDWNLAGWALLFARENIDDPITPAAMRDSGFNFSEAINFLVSALLKPLPPETHSLRVVPEMCLISDCLGSLTLQQWRKYEQAIKAFPSYISRKDVVRLFALMEENRYRPSSDFHKTLTRIVSNYLPSFSGKDLSLITLTLARMGVGLSSDFQQKLDQEISSRLQQHEQKKSEAENSLDSYSLLWAMNVFYLMKYSTAQDSAFQLLAGIMEKHQNDYSSLPPYQLRLLHTASLAMEIPLNTPVEDMPSLVSNAERRFGDVVRTCFPDVHSQVIVPHLRVNVDFGLNMDGKHPFFIEFDGVPHFCVSGDSKIHYKAHSLMSSHMVMQAYPHACLVRFPEFFLWCEQDWREPLMQLFNERKSGVFVPFVSNDRLRFDRIQLHKLSAYNAMPKEISDNATPSKLLRQVRSFQQSSMVRIA